MFFTIQTIQVSPLFLLQFGCCLVTGLLGLILITSHFLIHCKHKGYEASRKMLAVAMIALCLHYILQMVYGIREMGDNSGAAFNMLFYVPVSLLVSYAIYNIEGHNTGKKIFLTVGIASIIVTYGAFIYGYIHTHSLNIGNMLYVMFAAFLLSLIYYIAHNLRAMTIRHRHITDFTGVYTLPYNQYIWSSYALLCTTTLIIAISILSRSLLLIAGPLMLLSLFIFTLTFIELGNYIIPIADVLSEEDDLNTSNSFDFTFHETEHHKRKTVEREGCLTQERMQEINSALQTWCMQGGYRDYTANIIMLSQDTKIRKEELCLFFDQYKQCTFRTWICDIRVKEAQRLLMETPNMKPHILAKECGFMSYEHLCIEFKIKTRMTPEQWKNRPS